MNTLLTEVAEVATETTTNKFMEIIDKIYNLGSWVKPTMLVLGGVFILGILAQVIVSIAKGK